MIRIQILLACVLTAVVLFAGCECQGQEVEASGVIRDRWESRLEEKQSETVAEVQGLRDVIAKLRDDNQKQVEANRLLFSGLQDRMAERQAKFESRIQTLQQGIVAQVAKKIASWQPGDVISSGVSWMIRTIAWVFGLLVVLIVLTLGVLVILAKVVYSLSRSGA